jgi:hypothetical protein
VPANLGELLHQQQGQATDEPPTQHPYQALSGLGTEGLCNPLSDRVKPHPSPEVVVLLFVGAF